jgi:hypothetical protein
MHGTLCVIAFMRDMLTILGLIISMACSGQADSLKYKVFSDFINADIYSYDTMFRRKTELILVTTRDKFEPTIDIEYLKDFLEGNIEENELYKSSFAGQDPATYFDMPPTFGLGQILKEDKELGDLMIAFFQNSKLDFSSIKQLKTNYQIKVIQDPKPYFKMGWNKFHRKYPNCYGIIRLSNIVFNESQDRAIMYIENFKGSLDGSGDIVIMRKTNNTWTIELQINQWMS